MQFNNNNEPWIRKYWRPAMAWQYMIVCIYDFILAPSVLSWLTYTTKMPYTQWQPLTLQGSGLYHLAMGAIIGVSAWSRGQEKMEKLYIQEEEAKRE